MKHGSGKTCPWIPLVHHQSNCFHILGCWLYRPGEWSHEWGNDLRFQQKNHPSSGGSASVVRPGLPGVHGVFCLQCHCAGGRSSALLVRPPSVVDGIPYLSILDTPSGIWTPSIYIGVVWVVNLGVYAVQCRHIYIYAIRGVFGCVWVVFCVFLLFFICRLEELDRNIKGGQVVLSLRDGIISCNIVNINTTFHHLPEHSINILYQNTVEISCMTNQFVVVL